MPLVLATGDLFDADVAALVNPVNCVGICGKGLARAFAQRFPRMESTYKRGCARGTVAPGRVQVVKLDVSERSGAASYVINFPTKRHWRDDSRLDDVANGLDSLVDALTSLRIDSVAIPALGCGNGKLAWNDVFPLIEATAARIDHVRLVVYPPT